MSTQTKYWVIIPAAGSGKRTGSELPKQYIQIQEKFILDHAIGIFLDLPQIEKIVVVLSENDPYWNESIFCKHERVYTTIGGKERFNSVFNGLEYLTPHANDDDWVLVHDAARPCLDVSDVRKLIDELKTHEVGGLLALRVKDTMKLADQRDEVKETVNRTELWHALTPQMFRYPVLKKALEKIIKEEDKVTDESQAIEYMGLKPKLIEGQPRNIKITNPEDISLAEYFLNSRKDKYS